MGVIITPPGGGANYPNISDVANVVTINPTQTTTIQSDAVAIIGENQLEFYSNTNGNMNIFGIDNLNISDVNVANFLSDNAFIVAEGGKVGFFSDTISATQYGAITDATLLNYIAVINNILAALRSYNLIQT